MENFDGNLRFSCGMAQPMLNYVPMTHENRDSDILRFCVYVETDHDTDDDGWTGADFGENPDYVYEDEEEAEG